MGVFTRGVNAHNAPLCPGQPDFGGQGAIGIRNHLAILLFRRLTGRDPWTKAVAQWVHQRYDQGQIIREEKVEILPDDTAETLAERVLAVEHRIQIKALKDIATGTISEVRPEPIVKKNELAIWALVREIAVLAYPKVG